MPVPAAGDITMDDPQVYLEKLSAFSRMLRLEGLTVSPQETQDSARILVDLGLADRNRVKTALRTVYAKSREEQLTFDRCFDSFFISEERMRQQAKEQQQREQEVAQHRQEAEEELQINGQPMDLDEKQWETYAAMPEEARQRLRNFMEKYRSTVERNTEPERMARSSSPYRSSSTSLPTTSSSRRLITVEGRHCSAMMYLPSPFCTMSSRSAKLRSAMTCQSATS